MPIFPHQISHLIIRSFSIQTRTGRYGLATESVLRFFFSGLGVVTYVTGISAFGRNMEPSGFAWIGIQLDDGGRVDVPILNGSVVKGVQAIDLRQSHKNAKKDR